MSTSEPATTPPRFHPDPQLVRRLALVNGAVPAALLLYDAWQSHLGANGTKFAIHTTGKLALVFFLLSLTVTPLKRLTHWNELVASRRALGLYGFFYLVAHFVIFFAFDREGSVSSTVAEILKRRYLQVGTIALLLFIPVAVTSTDRMITRLGPRRWKRLHRLSYLGAALGSLHYILQTKSDLRQPLAFAGVLGALLGFRVIAHYADRGVRAQRRRTRAIWSGELEVVGTRSETHDVQTFRLASPGGGPLPFRHRPGQYLNISLAIDGQRVNRSYTIASAPTQTDGCEITVKKATEGWASRHLHESLRTGARVKVSAPAGRFVFDGAGASRVTLIAGGVGITPLMAMVRTLAARGWKGRVDLVYSVKTRADIVFDDELQQLARAYPDLLHLCVTVTREPEDSAWAGARGPITRELLEREAPGLRTSPIYLCGPEPMMAALKKLLAELGAPPANVHVEAFVSPPQAPAVNDAASVASEEDAEAAETPARKDGAALTAQFVASGETTAVEDGQTLLEAAEEIGIDIPFDCRSGICGQCKTRLLRGRVVMEVQDALTTEDRKKRLVLACQARPVGDVVVDA